MDPVTAPDTARLRRDGELMRIRRSAYEVREAEAQAFADPRKRRVILELVRGECSAQRLAAATAMPLNLLHYHLGRLQALKLVKVARAEPRAGRAVKHYAARAQAFFVPGHLLPDPGEKHRAELQAGLDQARLDGDGGTLFFHADGKIQMRRIAAQHGARAAEHWRMLALSEGEVRSLAAEIAALLDRYTGTGKGKKPYLVYAGIAPRV